MLPFTIRSDGRLVGQMVVFGIAWGSLLSAAVGYWVDEDVAGRGVAPTALALAGDHALGSLGLHRLEVNIRPENANSLAVVRKLGFRDEGVRAAYLHINGAWRDHRTFALTAEDLGGHSMSERLHTNHTSPIGDTPPHLPPAAPEST
jgi:ribosomal-protein-alanine N-acetyltransferase